MLKKELWKRRTMAKITMLRRNSIIEKIELLKVIQQNGTKEQEVIQELRKEDRQAWEDNGIVYVDGQIYIPNNKKIWEQVLWENHDLADVGHSAVKNVGINQKKFTGSQESRKMSRNTFKDVSNANRTKYSIKRKQKNYTHWKYHKDLGRKSVLILLAHYQSQIEKMLLWLLWIDSPRWSG